MSMRYRVLSLRQKAEGRGQEEIFELYFRQVKTAISGKGLIQFRAGEKHERLIWKVFQALKLLMDRREAY
jgi:hypothetical protein